MLEGVMSSAFPSRWELGGGLFFLPSGHPAKNNSRLQQVGTGRERLEPDLQSDAWRAKTRFIEEVSREA